MGQALRRLRTRVAPGGLILCYHRVADEPSDPWSLCVTPAHFRQHLDVLRQHARPSRLTDLVSRVHARRRPYKNVVITFDDGYADNLLAAKPLLEQAGVPATVYVVSGHVGHTQEFWWDELERILLQPGMLPPVLELELPDGPYRFELGESRTYSEKSARRHAGWRMSKPADPTPRHAAYRSLWQRLHTQPDGRASILTALRRWAGAAATSRSGHRTLTSAELTALADGGLIEIGAHTVTHPNLPTLSADAQRLEIMKSKSDLEVSLGRPVTNFAYPHGLYTRQTADLVREAGFQSACTTWSSVVWRGSDLFTLPRVAVDNWDGEEFSRRLARWFQA